MRKEEVEPSAESGRGEEARKELDRRIAEAEKKFSQRRVMVLLHLDMLKSYLEHGVPLEEIEDAWDKLQQHFTGRYGPVYERSLIDLMRALEGWKEDRKRMEAV